MNIEGVNFQVVEIQILEKSKSQSIGIYLVPDNLSLDSLNKQFVNKFIEDNNVKIIKQNENSVTFSSTATFGDPSQTTVTFDDSYIIISGYGFIEGRDYANFLTSNGLKAIHPKKIGVKNNFY